MFSIDFTLLMLASPLRLQKVSIFLKKKVIRISKRSFSHFSVTSIGIIASNPLVNTKTVDSALIRQIQNGDQKAQSELVKRYQQRAYTLCVRMLKHEEEAEEACMDAFINAFQHLKEFRAEAQFSTWLYRIVYNQCLQRLRKKQHYFTEVQEHMAFIEASSFQNLQANEKSHYIRSGLRCLKEEDAGLLTLFYLQEQNLEEIAAVTGIPANTAKVKIHRARKKLKEVLERHLKTEVNSLL